MSIGVMQVWSVPPLCLFYVLNYFQPPKIFITRTIDYLKLVLVRIPHTHDVMYYVPCNSCVSTSYAPQLLCIQAFVCPRSCAIHGLGGWKVNPKKEQASFWTWWQLDTISNRLFGKLVPNQLWRYGIILGNIEFCHWQMKKTNLGFWNCHKFSICVHRCPNFNYWFFSLIFLTFEMQDVNFFGVKTIQIMTLY
jgi:hypothetical protein